MDKITTYRAKNKAGKIVIGQDIRVMEGVKPRLEGYSFQPETLHRLVGSFGKYGQVWEGDQFTYHHFQLENQPIYEVTYLNHSWQVIRGAEFLRSIAELTEEDWAVAKKVGNVYFNRKKKP